MKRAQVFDTGQIAFVHGRLSVEISDATQVEEIDLNDVPDDQFREMMQKPNDFKVVGKKGKKRLERK